MGASYFWGGLVLGLCCVPALIYGTFWWVGRHRVRAATVRETWASAPGRDRRGEERIGGGEPVELGLAELGGQISRDARARPTKAPGRRSRRALRNDRHLGEDEPVADRILARTPRPEPARPGTVVYPARPDPVPRARRPPGAAPPRPGPRAPRPAPDAPAHDPPPDGPTGEP